MKTIASNIETSFDGVLAKLIDYNLASNKKTSTGHESFRMIIEEHVPVYDQIYFTISDSDKNSSEQLTDDSHGIPDSSQVSTVPRISASFSHISTNFVTDNLCSSISKENNMIFPLNNRLFHQFQQIVILS